MSCIVYQTDKKTGVKYAYESESYWDSEKQQPRSRRKYLGKVDPETGEIITKRAGKTAKSKTAADSSTASATETSAESIPPDILLEKDEMIAALRKENAVLKKEKQAILASMAEILGQYQE